jgi:hypothetical protein
MTNTEKQMFIESFINSVKKSLLEKIDKNLAPENWDGYELRQWCADSFLFECYPMDKKRKKTYMNDVLINNL